MKRFPLTGKVKPKKGVISMTANGLGGGTRTRGFLIPSQARCQAALHPAIKVRQGDLYRHLEVMLLHMGRWQRTQSEVEDDPLQAQQTYCRYRHS